MSSSGNDADNFIRLNIPKEANIENIGDPSKLPPYVRQFLTKNNWNKYREQDIYLIKDDLRHSEYLYTSVNDVDINFFKKQVEFLSSLSPNELLLLHSYTYQGDRIINSISKNPYDDDTTKNYFINKYSKNREFINHLKLITEFNEEVTQENIFKFFTLYATKVWIIFNKAPAFEKEVRLFRGLKFEDKPPKIDSFQGIISTAYKTDAANLFTGKDCCMLDIKVKPGVKGIWLSPISRLSQRLFGFITDSENEIALFCTNTKTQIIDPPVRKIVTKDGRGIRTITTYDVILEPVKIAGNKKYRKTRRTKKISKQKTMVM